MHFADLILFSACSDLKLADLVFCGFVICGNFGVFGCDVAVFGFVAGQNSWRFWFLGDCVGWWSFGDLWHLGTALCFVT